MKRLLTAATLLTLAVFISYAAGGFNELVKLVKSGSSDEVIIAYINNYKESFDLTADNIERLKTLGASDKVITAAIQHKSLTGNSKPAPVYVYGTVPPTGEWVFINDYWYWEFPSGIVIDLGWQPSHFYFGHSFGSHGHWGRR